MNCCQKAAPVAAKRSPSWHAASAGKLESSVARSAAAPGRDNRRERKRLATHACSQTLRDRSLGSPSI